MRDARRLAPKPALAAIRQLAQTELAALPPALRQVKTPAAQTVKLSPEWWIKAQPDAGVQLNGCTVCAFSLARFSPLPTASPSKQIAESVEIVRHTVAPGFGLFGKVNVFVPIDFPSNPLVLDNLWMLLKETAHEFRMFGNVVAFDTSVRSIIGTMSPPQEK